MSEPNFSSAALQRMRAQYEQLKSQLLDLEWISQGSIIHKAPNAWAWTRKVKAKTVTVALSQPKAALYQQAIANHRKLELILSQMRELSQKALQHSAPNARSRQRKKNPKNPLS